MRLILPGELAKHAISEGTKSVTKVSRPLDMQGGFSDGCHLSSSPALVPSKLSVVFILSFDSLSSRVPYVVVFHTSFCCIRSCGYLTCFTLTIPSPLELALTPPGQDDGKKSAGYLRQNSRTSIPLSVPSWGAIITVACIQGLKIRIPAPLSTGYDFHPS